MQQRVTQHYMETYLEVTVTFQRSDYKQQPCATYTSTEDLLKEVDEAIRNKGNKQEKLALTQSTQIEPPPTPHGKSYLFERASCRC
jgi:hypothetical protein